MRNAVATQLCDDVDARVITPLAGLFGVDLHAILRDRVEQASSRIVAQLSDAALAAPTARDVMSLLWGESDPEPQWWRTTLGRACAAGLTEGTSKLTHAQAAQMLGVTRGTVATLTHRGTLDRHPDGGVLEASVMQRLARGPLK